MFVSDQPPCEPPLPGASVDALEARVAELCGIINVATAELVDTLAAVEATERWGVGYRSFQHWVMVHTGLNSARANALVGLARRVEELPETMSRFRDGALAEDQVVPIARHVPAEAEGQVAELASHATALQVSRVCREYRFRGPADPTDPNGEVKDSEDDETADFREAREARRSQSTTFGWDDEDFWRLAATLVREDGALAQKALEAARDELFEERCRAGTGTEDPQVSWADAFVRMSEHALAHMAEKKGSYSRDRTQVILHRRLPDAPANGKDPAAWLHRGPSVNPTLADLLSCDADVLLLLEREGRPTSLSRKTRSVPDYLRRLIEDRDKGCRFPGCTNGRWLDIHHIEHWLHGGDTDTCNLCALCKHHHRAHHRSEFTIEGDNANDPNGLVFRDKWGKVIPNGPRPIPLEKPPPRGKWKRPSGEPLNPKWIHFPIRRNPGLTP